MAQKQDQILYELKGASLEAAKRLKEEVEVEISVVKPLQTGNMGDISESWQNLYRNLLERLAVQDPEISQRTGLNAPCIRVYKGVQTLPRAYEEYPAIFLSSDKNPRYFMYAPVDYKGNHFVPEGAQEIKGQKKIDDIGNLLFAGGWLGNAPLFDRKKTGVETPEDYNSPSISALRKQFKNSPNDRMTYLAQGLSLEIVENFKQRQIEWRQSIDKAKDLIKKETMKNRPKILKNLPEGEDIYINSSYSYSYHGGDKVIINISVCRDGKTDIWQAGKRVDIPPSPAYTLQGASGVGFDVVPRRDTVSGRKLAALMDAIPLTPGLRDYPDLYANFVIERSEFGPMFGENGFLPTLIELEGYNFLLYTSSPEDRDESFCPPDALPVPVEVYEWLQSDKADRNMGITPPPRPAMVRGILDGSKKYNGLFVESSPSPDAG